MVKEEIKENKNYELVQVPTGSALAFRAPNGEILSQEQVIIEILNKLDIVQKAISNS